MCFKKPKTPVVVADPELARQKADAEQEAAILKGKNKDARTAAAIAAAIGNTGRGALLSGGAGGAGFAAPQARSLFTLIGG